MTGAATAGRGATVAPRTRRPGHARLRAPPRMVSNLPASTDPAAPGSGPGQGAMMRHVRASLLPALRQARDLADRSYAQPLDLDDLAAAAHVSRYHFARAFAATYGETPMRYLTRRRIERAQDLLRSANLTVTEVCMVVGFSSLGSFSSRFRELVGESPTQYRDRWTDTGGPHIPGCFLFMRGIDVWAPPADPAEPAHPGAPGGPPPPATAEEHVLPAGEGERHQEVVAPPATAEQDRKTGEVPVGHDA